MHAIAECTLCRALSLAARQSSLRFGAQRHLAPSRADKPSPGWPNPISSSSILVHSKSTFEAFASPLPLNLELDPSAHVVHFLAHLVNTHSRTKRATHAMWAWRTLPASGPAQFAASDGGEAGAGERLSRLLEVSRSENVLLVVYRWYGGVKLGSQRWKCISEVAKEALEAGGLFGPSVPPDTPGMEAKRRSR